ncbi:MAG: PAS domain S-box protein [Methanomicrobium sp.]|nr:PAS domain S-box protein [Methanomicrobium sp.]
MNTSGSLYEIIFDRAQTGLVLADRSGIVIAANKAFLTRSGYSEEEIVNKAGIGSFVHPADFERIDIKYQELAKAGISRDEIHEFNFLKKGGETLNVAATFSFDKETGFSVITILNITDKIRAVNDLKRRDAILEAINYSSNKFLKTNSWKDVMPDILRALGEAADVARIYCFENSTDENGDLLMNEIFEWSVREDAGQINNPRMQKLSYKNAGVLRWVDELRKGNTIFADINRVSEEERINMTRLGVRTSVIAPVFLNERWWGFVGFDETREDRNWSEAEIDTLGAAAGIIGSAIYKQETYETLIAYISEISLRIKEPGTLIKNNIQQIKRDILEGMISKESIAAKIDVQVKNIEQVNLNIKELNQAVIDKNCEIPDAYRKFFSH